MSDDKMFDYILARSRTRESSTLTIATVASTGSLVLITLFVQAQIESHNNLPMHIEWSIKVFGILFAVAGIVYREVTKYTIHQKDIDWLEKCAEKCGKECLDIDNPLKYHDGARRREGALRSLLIMPVIAWSFVIDPSQVAGILTGVLCGSYVVSLSLCENKCKKSKLI